MTESNLLYQIHKEQLMDFEEWKMIDSDELKAELLKNWRKKYSDKEIREQWKVKPPNYHYWLRKLNLSNKISSEEIKLEKLELRPNPDSSIPDSSIPDSSILKVEFEGNYPLIKKKIRNIMSLLEHEENEFCFRIEVYHKEAQG